MLEEFVERVLEGREGYRLERPWIPDEALFAVVPILRDTDEERKYYTLPEVDVEIKDTGYIGGVSVSGRGLDRPLLVLASEVLEGLGTQSRGIVHSTVVMPNTVKTLETRCVHRSHPITGEARFRPVGLAPISVAKYLVGGSQHDVWNAVSCFSLDASTFDVSSAFVGGMSSRSRREPSRSSYMTDSLPELMKQTQSTLSELLSKIPCFENQVGAIIIGLDGVKGMETFDHPKSWEARYKDVMGKHAGEVKKSKLFKIDEEECMRAVKEFLEKLKSAQMTIIEAGDVSEDYSVYRLKVDGYVGEAVFLYGELVYLFVIEGEEDEWQKIVRNVGTALLTSYDVDTVPHRDVSGNLYANRFRSSVKGVGWDKVISTLRANPEGLTWTELQRETGLNPTTLTNRLKDGMADGTIKKTVRSNGKTVYRIDI